MTRPLLQILAVTIAATPTGELTFLANSKTGRPMTKESFGNWFSECVRAAGIKGRSAHGLRKVAATRAANAGASEAELEAIFGWRGGHMAQLYTKSADRVRLGRRAGALLGAAGQNTNEIPHPIPAPEEKVRAPSEK